MVVSDKEMEEYARFAQLANEPNLRDRLMQVAREWMAAAIHERETPDMLSSR